MLIVAFKRYKGQTYAARQAQQIECAGFQRLWCDVQSMGMFRDYGWRSEFHQVVTQFRQETTW
jgi:hypothetical protein